MFRWLKTILAGDRSQQRQSPEQGIAPELAAEKLVAPLLKPKHNHALAHMFEELDLDRDVGREEEHEWLVQGLVAMVVGAVGGASSKELRDELAAGMERTVLFELFESPAERSQFSALFKVRLHEYLEALHESEVAPNRLGLLLAENLVGKPDIAVASVCRGTFHETMVAVHKAVKQMEPLLAV